MNELISVIVPVYKVEDYLDECIKSILNQTYKNLEIILVDDGSPDKCGQICDRYADQFSDVKVIHKINGGLSDARNVGFCSSKGGYVIFIDSDDFLERSMIETLYNNLIAYKADISVCGIYNYYSKNNRLTNQPDTGIVQYNKYQATENLYSYDSYGVGVWNKLFKREILENVSFPVGKLSEDYFVMHKYFMSAEAIVYDSTPLYNYRKREGSITKQKKTNLDMYDAIKEYYDYTKDYPELYESGVHAYVFACIATYDSILKNKDYTGMIPILKEGVFKNYKIALNYETVKNRKRQLKIFRYLYFLYPLAYRLFMKKRDKKTAK